MKRRICLPQRPTATTRLAYRLHFSHKSVTYSDICNEALAKLMLGWRLLVV